MCPQCGARTVSLADHGPDELHEAPWYDMRCPNCEYRYELMDDLEPTDPEYLRLKQEHLQKLAELSHPSLEKEYEAEGERWENYLSDNCISDL